MARPVTITASRANPNAEEAGCRRDHFDARSRSVGRLARIGLSPGTAEVVGQLLRRRVAAGRAPWPSP